MLPTSWAVVMSVMALQVVNCSSICFVSYKDSVFLFVRQLKAAWRKVASVCVCWLVVLVVGNFVRHVG